jgi:hypothetical protein
MPRWLLNFLCGGLAVVRESAGATALDETPAHSLPSNSPGKRNGLFLLVCSGHSVGKSAGHRRFLALEGSAYDLPVPRMSHGNDFMGSDIWDFVRPAP